MITAVCLPAHHDDFGSIPKDREIRVYDPFRSVKLDAWCQITYLAIRQDFVVVWIAKVAELVIQKGEEPYLLVRLSEVRSINSNRTGQPDSLKRSYGQTTSLLSFEDDTFFQEGEVIPFVADPDVRGPLSMERALEGLAETYGVSEDQIEITIRSTARTAKAEQ